MLFCYGDRFDLFAENASLTGGGRKCDGFTGKNGLTVDRTYINKDESAVLRHESAIRIGPCNFYFQLPQGAVGEEVVDQGEDGGDGGVSMDVDKDAEQGKNGAAATNAPAPVQKEKKASTKRTGTTYADMVMQVKYPGSA